MNKRALLLYISILVLSASPIVTVHAQTSFYRNLTVGNSGSDVIHLQNFLISLHVLTMPPGIPEGYFGNRTQKALALYQADKNIQPTKGYFGPITRARVIADEKSSTALTTPQSTCPSGYTCTSNRTITGNEVQNTTNTPAISSNPVVPSKKTFSYTPISMYDSSQTMINNAILASAKLHASSTPSSSASTTNNTQTGVTQGPTTNSDTNINTGTVDPTVVPADITQSTPTTLDTTASGMCTSNSPSAQIYVIMGQSNAAGVGKISLLPTTTETSSVISGFESASWPFMYWHNDTQTSWRPGSDILNSSNHYFGPDLGISSSLEMSGQKNFYIFKYAQGGTTLAVDWGHKGTKGIYDKAVASLKKAEGAICAQGKNPVVKAVFWMQGESDALSASMAAIYGKNLTRLISESRQDFLGNTAPFIIGLISDRVPGLWVYANTVRTQQKNVASNTAHTYFIETNDLPVYTVTCSTNAECDAHYTTIGQYELGTRFYDAYMSAQ